MKQIEESSSTPNVFGELAYQLDIPAEWELVIFIGLELILFLLISRLLYLITIYTVRFGKQGADPYIVASFIILGSAVLIRLVTNNTNYFFGFKYLDYVHEVEAIPVKKGE